MRAFASQAQRSQQRKQLQKKSSEQGVYLVALVVGMVGLTYASVPLYRCAADCFSAMCINKAHHPPQHATVMCQCMISLKPEGLTLIRQQDHMLLRVGSRLAQVVSQCLRHAMSGTLCRMFCQATGFGGTVQEGRTVEDKLRAREENPDEAVERAAAAREVTVSFNADVADGMPWRFVPAQRSVKVSRAPVAMPAC